jgi:hypothetical protein
MADRGVAHAFKAYPVTNRQLAVHLNAEMEKVAAQ